MLEIETLLSNELSKYDCDEFHIYTLIELIHPLLVKPREISKAKVLAWLAEKNLAFKSNPVAFLKKAFVEELNKGTFDKGGQHCYLPPLLNALEKHGIKVIKQDTEYMSIMFDYLINQEIMTNQELIEFNHKAIKYLANKGMTTSEFITLWKKSKIGKERQINWVEIDHLAEQQQEKWVELIKELEK